MYDIIGWVDESTQGLLLAGVIVFRRFDIGAVAATVVNGCGTRNRCLPLVPACLGGAEFDRDREKEAESLMIREGSS